MRALIFGASLIALSVPMSSAMATTAKPAEPRPSTLGAPPDMNAILGMFDKMFPPQPDPDPARLALAQSTAAAIWPSGSYGTLMTGMLGNVYDRVMTLKESDLPGAKPQKASAAGSGRSLHDEAIAKDPYFDQRSAAIRQVLAEQMGQISAIIDPRMRNGLARAMARRFDERQLTDINAFFATPTGHALAGQYLQIWVDPDLMRSMAGSMPEMMKLMPEIMQKVKAASDRFPAPPKPEKAKPVRQKH